MFQSEALQEKWGPVLDYDGLEKIEDSHKRAVTFRLRMLIALLKISLGFLARLR